MFFSSYIFFRYLLTRFFFRLMGLNIEYWRKQAEYLLNIPETEYLKAMNRRIVDLGLISKDGVPVLSMNDLSMLDVMDKEKLREGGVSKGTSFRRHTSGTTGRRTEVFLNRKELGTLLAIRDLCYRSCGIRLGDREARLWNYEKSSLTTSMKSFLLNRKTFTPVGKDLEKVVKSLCKWKPDYIYGYSSLILEIARISEEKKINFKNIKCVICTAETISKSQKVYIEKNLGVPVYEEYGSTEFDILGFEIDRDKLNIVNPWLYVESVEGFLTITDLSGRSQNFIRYQIGDVAKIDKTQKEYNLGRKFIFDLEGRSQNRFAYCPSGNAFHSSLLSSIIDKYYSEHDELLDFVIVQDKVSEINVYLKKIPVKGERFFEEYIQSSLKMTLGENIKIVLNCSNFPDVKGKRSYFIQNLKVEMHSV